MHLELEALARLVDEAPQPHEADHLRSCLVCRRELAEMREQTDALAGWMDDEDSIEDEAPPAAAWASLEAQLAAEGLIRPAPAAARPRVLALYRPPMRIAATIALLLVGGTGVALTRDGGADGPVAVDAPAPDAGQIARPAPVDEPVFESVAQAPAAPAAEPAAGGNGARLAMNGGAADARPAGAVPPRRTAPVRATRAEAAQAALELVRAQAQYVAALQRVAAIADPRSGNTLETRMAAVEQLVQLTAQALERVPGDPVINGYHLAAVAERDALRREMEKDAQTAWF